MCRREICVVMMFPLDEREWVKVLLWSHSVLAASFAERLCFLYADELPVLRTAVL
jgi:hypothetical protein